MKTKQEYILEGNFRQGLPDLYNQVINTKQDLHEHTTRLRQEVAKEISTDKLREECDYFNWDYISCWRKMEEEELREFKDYVNWVIIKNYQIEYLSEDFIREFSEYLNKV